MPSLHHYAILLPLLALSLIGACLPAKIDTDMTYLRTDEAISGVMSIDNNVTIPEPSATISNQSLKNNKTTVFKAAATEARLSVPVHAVARMDANCRRGPGTDYDVAGGLYQGQASRILGSNPDRSWWLIENPKMDGYCWIAAFTVMLNREGGNLPVMTAPPSTSMPALSIVSPMPQPVYVYHEYEQEALAYINRQRLSADLPELAMQPQLAAAARLHSRDMAERGYFSHTALNGSSPFERMNIQGYNYSYAAENIAAGHGTAQEAVQAWVNSDGHRQNMFNPLYTQAGIGYAFDPQSEYITYWTALFALP